MTMTTTRSRRWFLGTVAAVATTPFVASAQTERPDRGLGKHDDTSNAGLQGAPAGPYTSPALGMEVAWTAPWFERERSAADSFSTMREESITLNADGLQGFVGLYGIDPTRDAPTPSGLLDFYEGLMDQKLAGASGPATTVALHQRLESSLTVLFVVEAGNGPGFELWELRLPPTGGYATYSLMYSPAEDFPRCFEAAQAGIVLNGGAPFSTFDTETAIALATSAINGQVVGQTGQTTTQTGTNAQTNPAVLAPVRQHVDQLRPTVDEFVGLISSSPMTDAQSSRAADILNLWLDAPTVAAGVALPPELANIQSAYIAYTDNLNTIGVAFLTVISPDTTQAQKDAAGAELEAALNANANLAANLDALLAAAGA